MDARDSGRKSRSSKSRKKGGKATQARSAEDEARRREAVKQTLRVKLELERGALRVVERLLEDTVTEGFLVDCAWHITTANYKDTVEERSITKLCGYPLCPNKLSNVPSQQYKISTKTNKVYDITERKCFCSNFCYKASKYFELQISKTPLWLRKEESPPEVKLLKEGDGGSSGLEVKLVDKPVTEPDIENPSLGVPDPHRDSPPCSQSDSSDIEQDFVSSVVSGKRQNTRVHWGKLPKRDGGSGNDSDEKKQTAHPEPVQRPERENRSPHSSPPQKDPNYCLHKPEKATPVGSDVEGTRELLSQCSLKDSNEAQQEPSISSQLDGGDITPASDGVSVDLNITQVGMSKRGAAGLKGLLKDHVKVKPVPPPINLCLLEYLRQTFMEWRTEETMKFLYRTEYAPGTESTGQQEEDGEEELDEDDLTEADVEVGSRQSGGGPERPSAPPPDLETLRRETELLDVRVREFYKGVCVLPEEVQTDSIKKTEDTQDSGKDPPLPLVDSHAQHLIQKRIAVEKLSRSLRDVVGPLGLTMSDVINDINNLVRTFRFTNTNIIHKSPEWTLIAVVLLSVLTKVSPLLRESLASPSSVEYISSLMTELKLEDKDLHSLVLLFKPQITLTHYNSPQT